VDTDLHWAAGLFEGEGTFTMSKNGGKKRPYLTRSLASVANTDQEIVQFFADRWGGKVRKRKCCPPAKQAYEWSVTGAQAWVFATDVLPFLRTNRVKTKARLLIEAEEFRRRNARRGHEFPQTVQKLHEYVEAFRLLNQRGISTPDISSVHQASPRPTA
jgi:hypothetical protein